MRKVVVVLLLITSLLLLTAVVSGCGGSNSRSAGQFAFIRATADAGLSAQTARTPLSPAEKRAQKRARAQKAPALGAMQAADIDLPTGSRKIYTMNLNGQTQQAGQAANFGFVQLSLDGTMGVFSAEDSNGNVQVYVAKMSDPNNPTQLTFDAEHHYEPQLSPDNKTIVFVKVNDWEELWKVSTSGGEETQIVPDKHSDVWSPTFTPDGANIVFGGWTSDGSGLYIMKADGTGVTRLTSGIDAYPSVSPDNSTIAFERSGPGSVYNVFSVGITGELKDGSVAAKALTTDNASGDPLYVGNQIVFCAWERDADKDGDLYVMNADGSNQKLLTNDSDDEYFSYEWW